ncbi:hypothetical protein MKW98_031924, partial [Papaver atlanticum]
MRCAAYKERQSSMTENEREQILEKRRTSYQMQRTRVGDATNNEHTSGTSS